MPSPIPAQQNQTETHSRIAFAKTAKGNPIYIEQYYGEIEKAAESIYEKRLYDPIHAAILKEFGVGGFATFRDKEVNRFRDIMKKTARDKANGEIDTEAQTQSGASIITKALNSNHAKKDAYGSAKKGVNASMSQQAGSIIKDVAYEPTTILDMIFATLPAINKQDPAEKVVKNFTTEADKYTKALEPTKKQEAIGKAKALVRQVIADDSQKVYDDKEKLANDHNTESSNFVYNVMNNASGVGKQSYNKAMTLHDSNVNSAFSKAAFVVRNTVPNAGDSAEISFELNIPVGPAFIIIGIGASCEHDIDETGPPNATRKQDYYSIGAEINIGAGGKITGLLAEASLKGTLGLFLEATGKTPEEAINLMSYGIYRVMYTKSETLARQLWGNGGKTGFSKFEEAEMWAANIEENAFKDDDNTRVAVGAQATFSASAKTTEAFKNIAAIKGEGELQGQVFYEYSRKILEKAGVPSPGQFDDILKQLDDPRIKKLLPPPTSQNANSAAPNGGSPPPANTRTPLTNAFKDKKSKFKDNIHHKTKIGISASSEFKFGEKAGFSCGIEGGITFNHSGNSFLDDPTPKQLKERSIKLESIEFAINLGFPESVEDLDAFNQILPKVSDYASNIIGNEVNHAVTNQQSVGVVEGRDTALFTVNTSLQNYVNTLELDGTPFEDAWGSELSAGLSFEFDFLEGDHSIDFEVSRKQSHEFDFEVVNFKIEKSKRLFKKSLL